jgi:hypothetical protein
MKHAGKNNIKNMNSLTLGDEKPRIDTGQKMNSNHHIGSNPAQVSQRKCSVRFEILTEVTMSILVFWIGTPCGLVGRYQRFGELATTIFNLEDGGSTLYAKFESIVSYLYLNTECCLHVLVCCQVTAGAIFCINI